MATPYGPWIRGDQNEYYCCDPSFNQEEWSRVLAKTPRAAAQDYARDMLEQNKQLGECIPVWVRDSSGNVTRWEVERTFKPVYTAKVEL